MDDVISSTGPDRDLARAAQHGDAAALGILFERHRPRLYAHALQVLGHGPDAQDAVQDAFVIAIRRIGGLRDAGSVEGWLHTVLRSVCFSRLRGNHAVPVWSFDDDADGAAEAPPPETPEAAIEALAHRDWVWTAISRLSEPLRVVTMLRHFSGASSYEQIAEICGIPVGTVRSRLAEARRRLGDELLRTAQASHAEAAAREAAERSRIADAVADLSYERYLAHMADDVEVVIAGGPRLRGRDELLAGIAEDAEAGVGFLPTEVFAGPGITVVEARFVNPAHDPFHCPDGTTQVHLYDDRGLTYRMIWHNAPRAVHEAEA